MTNPAAKPPVTMWGRAAPKMSPIMFLAQEMTATPATALPQMAPQMR